MASPLLQQFSEVWDNIGMEERHRQDRREAIKVHLQNLLEEMLQVRVIVFLKGWEGTLFSDQLREHDLHLCSMRD